MAMHEDPYWLHHFEPYRLTHLFVVLSFAVIVSAMVVLRCRDEVCADPPIRKRMDRALGFLGLAGTLFVQGTTLWPSHFDKLSSLPLHICDVVMIVAPLSLLLEWRQLRAIAYFWGLGLSSLSFILPDLRFGPGDVQFWVFWTGHGVIIFTAVYEVTARGFRPRFRDWLFVAKLSLVYVAIIFPIDAYFHLNYGYIGVTYHHQTSPVDHLGPWPWRVPVMVVCALAVMLLLLLPWSLARRFKKPVSISKADPVASEPSELVTT